MALDPGAARSLGTVRVVGTGLLGASVGLGLSSSGARVLLADPSPTALALAADLGAGVRDRGDVPVDVVVVAAPPDVVAEVVMAEGKTHPDAVVTDVASVKAGVFADLRASCADLRRYVGGHPMAGRERRGAVAARGDLFLGRPWVLAPPPEVLPEAVDVVRRLVTALGADAILMSPQEHDEAVGLVSHVPQIAASLVAARLGTANEGALGLAGQGLRDVTRIAGSDPMLWAQILAANALPVSDILRDVRTDLNRVITALDALAAETSCSPSALGARAVVAGLIADGNRGRERVPGKHGAAPVRYRVITVVVPDRPGALGQLFAAVTGVGVNVEEVALEHAPGRAVGLLEVSVLPSHASRLESALTEQGWRLVG